MEKRSQFTIQFAALQPGMHQYDFHIDDRFFGAYEHAIIQKADIQVEALMEKGVNNLQFTFTFNGKIHLTCVRCLEEFDMPVNNEVRHLVVRLLDAVEEPVEEEEDIIALPMAAHEIDLAPHLYDYLNLMVPINPVHPDKADGESGCDPKAIEEMNRHLQNDPQNDPRWEMLKKLKLK